MPAIGKGDAVSPSLLPGESITIGYGSEGALPRRYGVRDDRDIEIGIVKLILSTKYVDYSNLKQTSPFSEGRANRLVSSDDAEPDMWCEKNVILVQRRGKSPHSREA